jgi:hypothetical protein
VASAKRPIILESLEVDYLRSLIDSGDATRIKNALQNLCRFYRKGLIVNPNQLPGVLNSVTGTAFNPNLDEKARRWVLNALARVGSEANALPAIEHLLRQHRSEPQTVAAAIAALFKLCKKRSPEDILSGHQFDPQMVTLAALQHVPLKQLDLSSLPLNIDSASPDLLKLALLVVGLDRSPENLLNPNHTDAEMVRVLGGHDDPIVSQYSVWAITENDQLGVANLGIRIADIESYPPNVRAWLLQLLAAEATAKHAYWEIIEQGIIDPNAEARRGLATGLRDTFVDIFEPWVLDWVGKEPDTEVRHLIIDHMVLQSTRSPHYEAYSLEIYRHEVGDSNLRKRMAATAAGTPLYGKFRRLDNISQNDLFGGEITIMAKEVTIGNITAGAVAVGSGSATNYGMVVTKQQVDIAQTHLLNLEQEIEKSKLDDGEKQRVLAAVTNAKNNPNPGTISKVIEAINGLGKLAEAGTAFHPYIGALAAIFGAS